MAIDIKQLSQHLPELEFKSNFSLSKLTYFQVGGPAEILTKPDKRQDLIDLIRYCQTNQIHYTIIGGGSNVIVSDQGLTGLVISPEHNQVKVIDERKDSKLIRVESGISTARLVNQTVRLGLTGLEPFFGVPGKLGGAIYNNSHYTTELIGDYVDQVEVIDQEGQIKFIDHGACRFEYDSSRFHETNEVILRVDFELKLGDKQKSREIIKQSTQQRTRSQPLNLPSSGCIFKNVPNNDRLRELFPHFADQDYVPGGFLIDQAGLKGEKVNDIEVSQKHAAFFVNKGQGRAEDIKALVNKVKNTVKKKFGVELEEEVFYLE
jgi:UDP-N-acetylmuramate dehydrogenase